MTLEEQLIAMELATNLSRTIAVVDAIELLTHHGYTIIKPADTATRDHYHAGTKLVDDALTALGSPPAPDFRGADGHRH